MEAVILAGGLGTRLRSAIGDLPKPMAEIHGRPFLEYLVSFWADQGVRHFVFSIGYRHELIQGHFGAFFRGLKIDYSVEEKLLGTGGALLQSMSFLEKGTTFLTINGDTFLEISMGDMFARHVSRKADVTLALTIPRGQPRYEKVEIDEMGRVVSFKSRQAPPDSQFVNGGVYLLEPKVFEGMGFCCGETLSLEKDIFPTMLRFGKAVYGYPADGRFIDIGTPEDYSRCENFFQKRKESRHG